MSRVYQLIFDQELPRVIDIMKINLQIGSEIIGDWFLYDEYTEIRLYGFTGNPFLLPAFLTNRIFSLEFARQIIHIEKEHFLNVKKGWNISFHYTIGPFVIKTSQSGQLLTYILDTMKFHRTKKINYDPEGIMASRKKAVVPHAFIHQEVAILSERSNSEVISLEKPVVCLIE